jgi:NADH:ubiquinone oxidoreductase subunit F (NADH-binding)
MSLTEGLDAPAIMRIGAARLTAGLDRMPRLDLEAHREIFGPLPRLSVEELISMTEQVDLRGQGGAAFPFARKLSAVMEAAEASDCPTVVVVNATEGEPGSVKDKMLMIRSPYLILSGAALVAEALGADEIVVGVAGHELANRSIEAAIAAESGLRKMARVVQLPDRFISGESGALVRGINGKRPVPPGTWPAIWASTTCPRCCRMPRRWPSSQCSRCSARSASPRSGRRKSQARYCSA